jgi:hypothetical protein
MLSDSSRVAGLLITGWTSNSHLSVFVSVGVTRLSAPKVDSSHLCSDASVCATCSIKGRCSHCPEPDHNPGITGGAAMVGFGIRARSYRRGVTDTASSKEAI